MMRTLMMDMNKNNEKSKKGKSKSKLFAITPVYHKLLVALGWLHYARCDMLTRLYYSPGMFGHTQVRLKELEREDEEKEKESEKKYVTYISINSNGKNTGR